MAPRRQYRKRIKKRPLSERSEFRTLPVSGAGGACSPRKRTAIVGSPSLAYFSWRSKRSRSAAGPRPGLPVRQGNLFVSPVRQTQQSGFAFCDRRCRSKGGFAATVSWRMKRHICPVGRPGRVSVPAAGSLLLLRQELDFPHLNRIAQRICEALEQGGWDFHHVWGFRGDR